jgi:hypothetical protein
MWASSHLPNMGPGCYKHQSGAAEAWWAYNPQVPGLKPGSDTISNDLGKNVSHICAITPKELVNLEFPQNSL